MEIYVQTWRQDTISDTIFQNVVESFDIDMSAKLGSLSSGEICL